MTETRVETTTLWRPVGSAELALVRDSGLREWPPRPPGRPVFHPVLNEDYAVRITREWNLPRDGEGHVTRFRVETSFLSRHPLRQVGGRTIVEPWAPAKEFAEFNARIHGTIELVRSFLPEAWRPAFGGFPETTLGPGSDAGPLRMRGSQPDPAADSRS